MDWTEQRLSQLLQRHETWLLSQPGVVGVGVALGRHDPLCLEVLTDGLSPATRHDIAERLRGAPVQFSETGPITAQPGVG
jgi:hypothetical protein